MPTYITDVYIVKLNAAGELVWGKSIASDGINQAWGVCVDEIGIVYVTGNFARKTDFNPSPRPEDTFYLETSSGTSGDAFVLKLSENGDFVWAAQFVSPGGGDAGKAIFAKNGYVYTTGLYQGKADFNPSPAPADTFYLYPNGNVNSALDIFISKLDTAGNFVWAKSVGSPTNNILREWGTGITVDEAGNV